MGLTLRFTNSQTHGHKSLALYIWHHLKFLGKIEIVIFLENTHNCFAYMSATKYHSEAVLYSKRMTGYPLSPHVKIIIVAFLKPE